MWRTYSMQEKPIRGFFIWTANPTPQIFGEFSTLVEDLNKRNETENIFSNFGPEWRSFGNS